MRCWQLAARDISIHALLAESDSRQRQDLSLDTHFYPRSPCGERPVLRQIARRAANFYPRSPCGERQLTACHNGQLLDFYPRSPCGERQWTPLNSPVRCYFYPRSPCGERHLRVLDGSKSSIISIHALLAESDKSNPAKHTNLTYFYPRSPCGERHNQSNQQCKHHPFLSTLSLRRATRERSS